MTTRVLPEIETETGYGEDEYAHIVTKEDQMRGYIEGVLIKALCGKVWVPNQDYEGLPVCPVCLKIKGAILAQSQN